MCPASKISILTVYLTCSLVYSGFRPDISISKTDFLGDGITLYVYNVIGFIVGLVPDIDSF